MLGWHSLGKWLQLGSLHLVKTWGMVARRAIINRWYMVTLRLLIFVRKPHRFVGALWHAVRNHVRSEQTIA